jgi:hypothetical protein
MEVLPERFVMLKELPPKPLVPASSDCEMEAVGRDDPLRAAIDSSCTWGANTHNAQYLAVSDEFLRKVFDK